MEEAALARMASPGLPPGAVQEGCPSSGLAQEPERESRRAPAELLACCEFGQASQDALEEQVAQLSPRL